MKTVGPREERIPRPRSRSTGRHQQRVGRGTRVLVGKAPWTGGATRRQLAGDARAGAWARGQAWQAQRRFVRRSWRWLTGGTVVVLGVGLVLIAVMPAHARGFSAGVVMSVWLGLVSYAVIQFSGSAGPLMGALAEQWSAAELRRLQDHGWRLVNGVRLRPWDIDHVLVGPGGVVAVETKWQGRGWVLDPPEDRVLGAARQAAGNARDLRLWGKLRAAGVTEVRPLVILWGALPDGEPRSFLDPATGAQVIPARCLAEWRERVLGADQVLNEAQVQQCWRALAEHAQTRDEREPLPPSVNTLAVRAAAGVAGGLAAVVALAAAVQVLDSIAGLLCAVTAAAGAGFASRRWARLRVASTGWLIGVAVVCGYVAVALARLAITQ